MLGAGIAPNTRDELAEWILNPHELKPGVRMPPTPLDDDDLEALLDYMEELE
jgi:cytochrome c oxidase subunit II